MMKTDLEAWMAAVLARLVALALIMVVETAERRTGPAIVYRLQTSQYCLNCITGLHCKTLQI